jgi:ubiquinone biosynthesis protein UbiJ
MFPDLRALLAPAVVERLTLLINHVLASEEQASRRLLAHQGRVLRFELADWPRLLPAPPMLAFRVTPAGLVEWCPEVETCDLRVRMVAANPAGLALGALTGSMPPLDIEGDAQFATDVDWLAKNLRWDLAADLERLFGPTVAHEIERVGSMFAQGLRSAVESATALAGRMRAR